MTFLLNDKDNIMLRVKRLKWIYFYFLPIVIIFISCNNEKSLHYQSKDKTHYGIELFDSLKFIYNDSVFIGNIGTIYKWNNFIFIQDYINTSIRIFDKNLSYLFSVGGRGEGPGEYSTPPVIIENNDTNRIYMLEVNKKRLYEYNSKLNYLTEYKLPSDFYYSYYPAIKIKDNFIFSVAYPFPENKDMYFDIYKGLVCLEDNFKLKSNFLEWDSIYFDRDFDAFTKNNFSVNLALTNKNYFFAQEQASFIIHKFDSNLDLVKSFGKLPKYFQYPPGEISFEQTQQSLESFYKFQASSSSFRDIDYDDDMKRIFICYNQSTKESLFKKDNLLALHYLQIYDNNFDCIFDEKIPGKFLFAEKSNLYILHKQEEKFVKIMVYRLKDIANEKH